MLSPKLEQELVSRRDKRLFARHHVGQCPASGLPVWCSLYRGWGAAKQVTESGAFLAFLISTLHWSVWQEIKRGSIEMSIQFDLKETRLACVLFTLRKEWSQVEIETTSGLSLLFMRGWKFVEISILTSFRRIIVINNIITAAGTGFQIS